jgi:hypothetical protein
MDRGVEQDLLPEGTRRAMNQCPPDLTLGNLNYADVVTFSMRNALIVATSEPERQW